MLRQLHSLPGLVITIFIIILTVSGAILSLEPAIDKFNSVPLEPIATASPINAPGSVAEISAKIVQNHAEVSSISRSANGTISVQYIGTDGFENKLVDPNTGLSFKAKPQSALFSFMKSLHRSLFIASTGNALVGGTALLLFVSCISGVFMLAKNLGGWRKLLGKSRGKSSTKLHIDISRIVIIGLLLSSLTGVYMSLVRFDFISSSNGFLDYPINVAGTKPTPISELSALQNIPISDLRELRMPFAGDPFDVYGITTKFGTGYIDQATGEMLEFSPNTLGQNTYEFVYMLHTGQGLWWLGILLSVASMGVLVLAVTGIFIWWKRKNSAIKLSNIVPQDKAKIVILVGSEGNSTWGFAQHLDQKLKQLGISSHITAMNNFAPHLYVQAKHLIVLTSTYGDGNAPANADQFLQKLDKCSKSLNYDFTVLGFGDRQFTHFCKFAHDVELAFLSKNLPPLLPINTIDRQSAQSFEQWGVKLGQALGVKLNLDYCPPHPSTCELILEKRQDYHHNHQHKTCILTFKINANLKAFNAGDLLAIMPPNSRVARFYSLASCTDDGKVEICVTLQKGGLCSTYLHNLKIGESVEAYIQVNENFKPATGQKPLILIGAGTGIAPFMGFIQANNDNRNIQLFWGGRHPESDYLYKDQLVGHLNGKKLSGLNTAFSRLENGKYVQDELIMNAEKIRQTIKGGGQVMICGGREMAQGVRQSLNEILANDGLNITDLKLQKRYSEDVY